MAKPILRAEHCARIHAASLDVLEKVGVRIAIGLHSSSSCCEKPTMVSLR